jgi:hypothetical protein
MCKPSSSFPSTIAGQKLIYKVRLLIGIFFFDTLLFFWVWPSDLTKLLYACFYTYSLFCLHWILKKSTVVMTQSQIIFTPFCTPMLIQINVYCNFTVHHEQWLCIGVGFKQYLSKMKGITKFKGSLLQVNWWQLSQILLQWRRLWYPSISNFPPKPSSIPHPLWILSS